MFGIHTYLQLLFVISVLKISLNVFSQNSAVQRSHNTVFSEKILVGGLTWRLKVYPVSFRITIVSQYGNIGTLRSDIKASITS